MSNLSELIQRGDWKSEKHVPIILVPQNVVKEEPFNITVSIGEEIPHPNTLEHHIKWIKVFYQPDSGKFPIEIATTVFDSHGESGIFTDYTATIKFKASESGVLYALSYCNIHGLWQSQADLKCK
ncbi:MAG: class II SORL domain-containing protein [Eubacteriales bacterium]